MTKTNESFGPHLSRKASKKGKDIAQPTSESESEEDVPRLTRSKVKEKGKATVSKKKAQKKKAPEKEPAKSSNSKKQPSYNKMLAKLESIPFVPTRYADRAILQELGIYEDVALLFEHMGLGTFFRMEYPAYKSPTLQFLASLGVYFDSEEDNLVGKNANITFEVDGEAHKLTFQDVDAIYGFKEGRYPTLSSGQLDSHRVWREIGSGAYTRGATKGSGIRNPAIRYAHKVLAHTLYARRETGYIREDEMHFLVEGVKPFLQYTRNGEGFMDKNTNVSLSCILLTQLISYRDWAWTTPDKTPQLSIGGIVTPLLEACGVDLGRDSVGMTQIDASYLSRADFLAGRLGKRYAYRFCSYDSDGKKKVLLPNRELTSLQIRDNVLFEPRDDLLYDPITQPPLGKDTKRKPARAEGGENEDAPPPHLYGSERYHFRPYDEPLAEGGLREAHEHIRLLQRWSKWQDKTIRKLVKTMKNLKKKVMGSGSSSSRNKGVDETVEDSVGEREDIDEMEVESRRSLGVEPSLSMVEYVPSRHSSYETRQAKRRAMRSPTPCSSNPSYSLGDSSYSTQF